MVGRGLTRRIMVGWGLTRGIYKRDTLVVTLCAQLTRDLLAIAKFLVFVLFKIYTIKLMVYVMNRTDRQQEA